MSRKIAREIVLNMTFSSEYNQYDAKTIMEQVLTPESFDSLSEYNEIYEHMPAAAQEEYIKRATEGVVVHMQELDTYIEKYSSGWNVGRISRIAKAILRLSMFEMLYLQIPVGASVNEAVEFSKKYDGQEMAVFVNGILSSFVKNELGATEEQLKQKETDTDAL